MTDSFRLDTIIKAGCFSHAWIFTGAEDGRNALAAKLAKALLCRGADKPCGGCLSCAAFDSGNNPDVKFIRPDKKTSVSADYIREGVVADASIKPYYSTYKAYIITQADLLTVQAQNILLKTLEEPPPYGVFILCAEKEDSLLPTVLSRCVRVKADTPSPHDTAAWLHEQRGGLSKDRGELSEDRGGLSKDECYFYAALSNGSFERAFSLSEPDDGPPKALKMRGAVLDVLTTIKNLPPHEALLKAKRLEEYKDDYGLLLDIMALWYRDCAVSAAGGGILQKDIADRVKSHSDIRAARSVETVEDARGRLLAGTSFLLTFEVLLLGLRG